LDPLAWTNCVFDWTRASDADGKTEVCLGLHSASIDAQNANIKVHDIASWLADEVNGNTNPVGTG